MFRKIILGILLCFIALSILAVFWQQEMKYLRPTPIPKNYRAIDPGSKVENDLILKGEINFLHFYNPDCPCSRFNARHVKSLIHNFEHAKMRIVVPNQSALKKAMSEFDGQEFIVDNDEKLAKACGVYSTPQAVIIDQNGLLYYRGNYNRSRYCTTKATNYAELALVSAFNGQPAPVFGMLATQSYGCELSVDKEESIFF